MTRRKGRCMSIGFDNPLNRQEREPSGRFKDGWYHQCAEQAHHKLPHRNGELEWWKDNGEAKPREAQA